MAYGWNISDLYVYKKKLLKLLKHERNDEQAKYLQILLSCLNEYIIGMGKKDPLEDIEYDERLGQIESELSTYSEFYSLIEKFYSVIYDYLPRIERIESILKTRIREDQGYGVITGATLSNRRAFSLTNEFYRSFDYSLYPLFLEAYNDRLKSVRFVESLEGDSVADSFYLDIIRKSFMNIVKTDDVNKFYNMVHEYGHIISYILNPKAIYLSEDPMYTEVAAMFPEMVARHINFGHFNECQVGFEDFISIINLFNTSEDLILHGELVELWKRFGRQADIPFINQVNEELQVEVDELEKSMDSYIDDCGAYVISYLVSLELLHIYKKDKKKALEIFKSILKVPYDKNAHEFIGSQLVLGSHLEEETELFLDSFELKLKKSGVFHV